MLCVASLRTATCAVVAWIVYSAPLVASALAAEPLAAPEATLAPRGSDVVFSPRFLRQDSARAAQAWGATRIEWVYVQDAAAAALLARMPRGVGQTLNANAVLPRGEGYALDFDGQPLVAPWMKSWGAKWVTTTHDETRQVLFDQLDRIVAMGARSVQIDDPLLQYYSATHQGGDFNSATQAGFRDWLRERADPAAVRNAGLSNFDGEYREWLRWKHQVRSADDYRRRFRDLPSTALWLDYIRSTVVDYVAAVRERLHAVKPKAVALSMNLTGLVWPDSSQANYFLVPYADYVMAEMPIIDTDEIVARAATARALRVGFVPSLRPVDLARNRVAIATLYALGTQPLVPWDVFVPDKPRYYGTLAEYGDIYRFVRSNAALFDRYDQAATVGVVVDPGSFPVAAVRELVRRLGERQIAYEFVLVGSDTRHRALFEKASLGHLSLLFLAVPEAQLDATQRAKLQNSGVPQTHLERVTTSQLDALRSVVVAPSAGAVKVYIREDRSSPGAWLAHVIDEHRGEPPSDANSENCDRRIGFLATSKRVPPPENATWITPSARLKLRGEGDGSARYFTLPTCPVWGILLPDPS